LKYFSIFYPIVPNGIDFLEEIYGIPRSRMKLLPLGYDEQNADNIRKEVDRHALRAQLGLSENDFLIITGGKFTEEKRTELLLDSTQLMRDKHVHVLGFGWASEKDKA